MTLKFIADESCDFALVRGLRSAGHDVTAIAEIIPGANDLKVLEKAAQENRILLTEDKDFGEWVFAHGKSTAGILPAKNVNISVRSERVTCPQGRGSFPDRSSRSGKKPKPLCVLGALAVQIIF